METARRYQAVNGKKRGRKPRFTLEEIEEIKEAYNRKDPAMSAREVGLLFRASATTVLNAVDGKLKPKEV